MVERFFSTNTPNFSDSKADLIMLLSGPPSSGKTSLLFQFAFNSVVDTNDKKVVLICSRRKLQTRPPYLSRGIDPSSHVFHRIVMKKCQQKYNSRRGRDLAIVRTLALCRNAINHANKTGPCKLLFSETHHGNAPRLLYIYNKWVSSIYTIKGNGSGSFLLKNNTFTGMETERMKTAKYSISLKNLVLEEISEHEEEKSRHIVGRC